MVGILNLLNEVVIVTNYHIKQMLNQQQIILMVKMMALVVLVLMIININMNINTYQ